MTADRSSQPDRPVVTLPGDIPMPALGFGTFELKETVAHDAVAHALKVGYRHIDTADMYGNHEGVGKAIKESGVAREEVFLVTKIWHDRLRHDDLQADAERSLRELRTDYVDQLLLHWPNSDIPMEETFAATDELVKAGKVRTVGVSNFTEAHLEKAANASRQPIAANQVELHPYLQQPQLREYCGRHGIAVVAYRPIVKGEVNEDETLSDIAGKHDATPVQVTLAWMLQRGMVTIPRSKSPEHIEQNFQALRIELDEDDLQRIDALDRDDRRVTPGFHEFDGPR
ncbi:MAG: aldo/keto reductase [Phycisphaerae bacterium]